MHEQRPSETEGEYLPPGVPAAEQPKPKPKWKTIGTAVGMGAIALAKFKTALLLLVNLKWLLFLPKLFFLFLSIWFYAIFFGWKFGIVFVLLILVHELGHYVTFRNFGIQADLPFFIPGFGAFVRPRGPAPSLTTEALATLAGPVYGLAASGLCYALALQTHDPFWMACAYTGCFLNAINLVPVPPLDGGGIAAAIDPRLWIVGAVAFLAFIVFFHIWAGLLIVLFVAWAAVPRIRAMLGGYIDPRFAEVPRSSRIAIAVAYFVTVGIAAGGAFVTYFDPRAHL
jgi:Zn-dependent protease